MEDIFMSTREVERYEIFQRCHMGEISLRQAARLLMLSYRQTKRLWKIYVTVKGTHLFCGLGLE